MHTISIVLVDDHKIFRDGVRQNFSMFYPNYWVIGEAAHWSQLSELLISGLKPDIILMDVSMPDKSGIEITRILKSNPEYSGIKVLILSAMKSAIHDAPNYDYVLEAIDAGAEGYLLKDSDIEQISRGIQEVINGGGFYLGETFDFKRATQIIIESQKKMISFLRKERNFGLTPREIEVLKFLSQGFSAKEIATKMSITEDVVTSFKDNIKKKLSDHYHIELKNMVEMVVWAIRNKVIES